MNSIYWHFIEVETLNIFRETLHRPQELGICVHAHGLARTEGIGLCYTQLAFPHVHL